MSPKMTFFGNTSVQQKTSSYKGVYKQHDNGKVVTTEESTSNMAVITTTLYPVKIESHNGYRCFGYGVI